jgi:HPt (histidine-containing phosphotransfer) domain-containing protein
MSNSIYLFDDKTRIVYNGIEYVALRRTVMDYETYLPDIDVKSGKSRVMDNLKLYQRLLGKFDAAKMAGDVIDAIENGDNAMAVQATHALRGTAANLGFNVVQKTTEDIELLIKNGEDCEHMIEPLNDAVASLAGAIGRFLAEQS